MKELVPWFEKPVPRAAVERMTLKLRGRFPAAFTWPPRPLMIDIYYPIVRVLYPKDDRNFDMSPQGLALREALHQWTHAPEYLAAELLNAPRFDLDGEQAGKVTLANAIWAAGEIVRQKNLRRSQLKIVK